MAIEVVNRQRVARIDARRVASIADSALVAIGITGSTLTVAFVRARAIRKLNRDYRNHDKPTDVLSFPALDVATGIQKKDFAGAPRFLGDIVVSTDIAAKQAGEAGHSFDREVDELVLHGVLHLCGYDHETDRGEMNRLEVKLRKKLLGK